jgi:hypothetical protein
MIIRMNFWARVTYKLSENATEECINPWHTNVVHMYGAPCRARNFNVVCIYMCVYIFMGLRLATLKAVSFYLLYNIFLCHSCV